MRRTSILADEGLLLDAADLAAREGKSLSTVIREALAEYIAVHRKPRQLSIIGIGEGTEENVSERVDEILAAEIDPIEGWSPDRFRRPRPEQPAS